MKPRTRLLPILPAVALIALTLAVPADASTHPVVTGLSRHADIYWGGSRITVHGRDFTSVRKVLFGSKGGHDVHVVSSTELTVEDPEHGYGTVYVRVVTAAGTSPRTALARFTFTRPTMNTPIQGGLTARQEQRISARVRAAHKDVFTARKARRWTPAMGVTAMRRARSWLGLPYSWAGGNGRGPTLGVCAHNGGDLDCHVVGFDCSGLALYAWAPYKQLVHYAATQYRAGRFHPAIGELVPGDLVFFSSYIPNGIGHVAIYEGHGNVIQAEQSGYPIMRSRLVDVIAASGHYRGATRPLSTGRQAPGPVLSSVTAAIPATGGYVTLTGSRLGAATSVTIGGKRMYYFAQRSATRLKVKAPPHRAGKVSVTVSTAWGSSRRTLTYVAAPTIAALSPSSGTTAGGTAVTVTGASLAAVDRVTLGTTPVGFTVVSASRLTFVTPPHAAGPVAITLRSPFGTSGPVPFTFVLPDPPSAAPRAPAGSSPPVSSPPVSSAPVSSAPVSSPPASTTPASSPPASTTPASSSPVSSSPVSSTPAPSGP